MKSYPEERTVGFEIVYDLFKNMSIDGAGIAWWNKGVVDKDVPGFRQGKFFLREKDLRAWTVIYNPTRLRWIFDSPEIEFVLRVEWALGFEVFARSYWFDPCEDEDEWPSYIWWWGSRNGALLCMRTKEYYGE